MGWKPTDSSGSCILTNNSGFIYEELTCLYPKWARLVSSWELAYDPVPLRDWMVANPWVPILAVVLYGVGIVLGRNYFREQRAWSWRRTLAAWNFSLSLFSAIGFCRCAVQLVHNLAHYSLHDNLCNDPEHHYGSGSSGIWIQFFVLSKFPELLDTFFIVIHKKPLIFLHWYHHITVLLYCWHSYVTKSPAGIYFATMNYAVHSVMYGYYFLMAIKLKPKWMNAMVITVAQISQMIVGVCVTALAFYYISSEECWIKPENNMAALVMYGSYLFLFLQFFVQRYFGVATKPTTKKKVA